MTDSDSDGPIKDGESLYDKALGLRLIQKNELCQLVGVDLMCPPQWPNTQKQEQQGSSKMLHIALYERRIAKFSQKYGLHMNKFMQKPRRNPSVISNYSSS